MQGAALLGGDVPALSTFEGTITGVHLAQIAALHAGEHAVVLAFQAGLALGVDVGQPQHLGEHRPMGIPAGDVLVKCEGVQAGIFRRFPVQRTQTVHRIPIDLPLEDHRALGIVGELLRGGFPVQGQDRRHGIQEGRNVRHQPRVCRHSVGVCGHGQELAVAVVDGAATRSHGARFCPLGDAPFRQRLRVTYRQCADAADHQQEESRQHQ